MNIDDALKFTQGLIENHIKKPLNDSQMNVLRGCLEGKSYKEIYDLYKIGEDYSKEIGSDLWKKLSAALKIKITKTNLRNVIEQHLSPEKQKISNLEIFPKCNDEIRDFVGRDAAITDINNLVNEGRKIIVIQAAGGVGKTTLAKQYLTKFDLFLPLEMAKEQENITAVESVVEEWLKQHFQEEPGREFGITLDRLKTQLKTRKVGVLIDNLEPALDEKGRFVEKHNGYVRLLGILADANVQSVTLITSRERLCDDRVNGIYHYPLSVLDVTAWQEFFTSRKIKIDTPSLEAMHKVYGGNAKAMDILLGVMKEDYKGDMAAYWQENCTLLETELKNLVESQFNRLQTLDTEAYKLLCRLGCFRYQDVPRVSIDALLALLWDVPEDKRRDVIKSLKNRCLVEFEKGEYWLHPVIRKQGIERLKASGEWEEVNRKAAEFWTKSVTTVETIDDARKAFEAYYHYLEIHDYEEAAGVIVKERDNKWETDEALGRAFYRLGQGKRILSIRTI
jgi:ferritin-like metal-binding protein YciE